MDTLGRTSLGSSPQRSPALTVGTPVYAQYTLGSLLSVWHRSFYYTNASMSRVEMLPQTLSLPSTNRNLARVLDLNWHTLRGQICCTLSTKFDVRAPGAGKRENISPFGTMHPAPIMG